MDRQRAGGNDDAAGQGTIGLAFHVSTGAGFLVFIARCLAPLVGAVIGSLVSISEHYLLALYAGFFLSMGATDLLPEAHSHPSWKRGAYDRGLRDHVRDCTSGDLALPHLLNRRAR